MLLRTLKIMYETFDQRTQAYRRRSPSPVPDTNSDKDELPQLSINMPGQYPMTSYEPEPMYAGEAEYSDGMETDTDRLTEQLGGTQLGSDEYEDHMEYVEIQEATEDQGFGGARDSAYTIPPDVHEVAFSPKHTRAFDENGVSWAIQWEVARYVTSYPNFSWEHTPLHVVPQLCGPSADKAATLADVLLKGEPLFLDYYKRERAMRQPTLTSPWEELDSEETYIRDNNRGVSIENPGGKVQQRLHLDISETGGGLDFKFTLEQPTKSKSCRFSRFLGSRRLVECHFSMKNAKKHKAAIIDFFVKKRLLINGRLFQAFYGHQGKVNLMEINQDFHRSPLSELGDDNRISLTDFIAWHNNLHLNSNQTINKWVSRFALGFSTSQPGIIFRPENIHFIDDIYATGKTKASAASHEIMTDGCGFLNYAALKVIQEKMAWESFCTCVQARIGGSKGLFMLHPEHRDPSEEPQIWLRSSQVKIQLNPEKEKWSPIHYILDVLSGSFIQESSSITYEMIMSLSENKVPDRALAKLLRDTIERDAQSMEPSSKPHGSKVLYDSVYATHRVLQSRLRQIISLDAHRAQALIELEDEDEYEGLTSAKWEAGPDPFSGQPASSQEQVLGWLQAGFSPTDRFVMEKLVYLQKKLMTEAVNRYRIAIPESVRALIVPDPLGVLEEGQVFFASSQPIQTNRSGLTHCITGPVLVSRNPCIQISDTRKVIAVNSHELWSRSYFDVIIFSTEGSRSLASLLSGGDYDGDTAVMIWDESITSPFQNSHKEFADPSIDFERVNFNKSKVVLRDIKAQAELGKVDITPRLVEAMLQQISPNQLGVYNMFYRNCAYVHGLDHPQTARLGHMFTQCLDAVKSGLEVKPEVFRLDRKTWDREPPSCFPSKAEEDNSRGRKLSLPPRKISERFILDVLQVVATQETDRYKLKLSEMRERCNSSYNIDQDLIRPLNEAEARVHKHPQFQEELASIKAHVKTFRDHFIQARNNMGPYSTQARYGRRTKKKPSISEDQESIRAVSEDYSRKMPSNLVMFSDYEVSMVAAAYAYQEDASRGRIFNFCFAVSWAELCAIKARASGGAFVTLTSGFIESLAIHRKVAKVFRNMGNEESEDEEV
ncbi:RNA-dependent RNA polymerase [Rhizoctonia solani 123E]|uniref:RNA-dependent RNA polymerase n=1 Tax=Rhizoctonia solani 123E TaxID=1423351 RepID=A0A074SDR5_9AGAM|nr:RNA-dependent RNA polymerase [Rhizoctonia solani 123E]